MLYPNDSADAFVEPRCRIGWKGHDMTAKRNQFTFVTALIAFVIAVFPGWTAARGTSVEPRVLTGTARLSLPFVANDGELPWEVAFSTPNSHGTLFVTRDGALVHALTICPDLVKSSPSASAHSARSIHCTDTRLAAASVRSRAILGPFS